MAYYLEFIFIFVIAFLKGCLGTSDHASILSTDLLTGYDSGILATCGSSVATEVRLDLGMRQVINLDEPQQILKLNIWIRLKWIDCRLSWNPIDYGNISNIVVPYKYIWTPDITLFDSVATDFVGLDDFRPNIYSDGSVYYNFPTILESLCPLDVTKFPYDTQICKLVFGSWSHHGLDLNLVYRNPDGDLSSAEENVEWEITSFKAERHVIYYGCCPEPYPDVTFYLSLKRKPNFYISNLIIPSFLIVSMATLGFILPVESGEKVSLEVTVMLSLSVFQLLVAESLPPSDETPLISAYFNFTLFLVGFGCMAAVIVIAIYHQESNRKMPRIIRLVCLQWLSKVVCVWSSRQQRKKDPDGKATNIVYPETVADYKTMKTRNVMTPKKINKNIEKDKDENKQDRGLCITECDENKTIAMCTNEDWIMLSIISDRISCVVFILILTIGTSIIFAKFETS